ncbi:MAG: CPBP family intramembrane metalloprotease [Roseburia sp.]|nr:CPBP family intramembrane metalloprotease [Roseburia sp.]
MTALFGVKRDFRAVSYALCSAVVGIILMRIIVYFVPIDQSTYGMSIAATALFALPVQLVFLLAVPFCIYKFYGKRTFRQVAEYSSCTAFKPYFLIAVPLGIFVYFTTIGVSSVWMALLRATGYVSVTSTPDMPENFVFGFFLAEVVLTAVLPAVCEEFAMRGGFLTTARSVFGTVGCVALCGIAFGLFHQNVKQVFYTACFGALAAFLTLRLKSIYPAMLMHFTNNFCSVFFDYADNYDWAVGGGLFDAVDSLAATRAWALALIFVCVAGVSIGLVYLMIFIRDKKVTENKIEVLKDSAFDATNKRVVLMGEFDPKRVEALEMEKEVYGADYREEKTKPTLRDVMIVIGLAVVTVLTTVFTYVWGFFY